jgi:SAM-dependent methyltransferase
VAADFWEDAAQNDPLDAILSDPSRRGRQWDMASFFETGRREISLLLYQLRRLGHPLAGGRALDFGCGVGRLTQALAPSFGEVVGLDVSPTMIALAERLNRFPEIVRYVRNAAPLLSAFPDGHFDFVYSDIVLQHLDPPEARAYVAEFIRVLRPGGLAVFQLPSRLRTMAERPARPSHMPDIAYRARIEAVHVPSELPAAASAECTCRVQNASVVAWRHGTHGVLRLGNHWRDTEGKMLVQDDGRVLLPENVEPGETVALTLTVEAPPDAGRYLCEFDVVHEAISWFADKGSEALRVPIRVGGAGRQTPPSRGELLTPADIYPDIYSLLPSSPAAVDDFPMHGVPRPDVERLVHDSGGRLLFVEPDERGGPEWEGYRYFTKKRGAD